MSVTEIENELKHMSNAERLFVIEIATKLLQKEISVNTEFTEMQSRLKQSALIMESEYLNNKELTAVTKALEYEDFHDA